MVCLAKKTRRHFAALVQKSNKKKSYGEMQNAKLLCAPEGVNTGIRITLDP